MEKSKEHSCCAHKHQHENQAGSHGGAHEGHAAVKPWYRSFLFLSSAATVCLYVLARIVPELNGYRLAVEEYARMMALPIAAGLLLGAMIDYGIPTEYISRLLAAKRKRTIALAASLGFLMSACSHGILALSMALYRKGASAPAVVAFLLASPWANLPMTLLLIGFFGWKGILIIITALGIALLTGLALQFLDKMHWIEHNPATVTTPDHFSMIADIKQRWAGRRFTRQQLQSDLSGILKSLGMLMNMVLPWILIGGILAGLAAAWVPEHFFHRYYGPTLLGLLITLVTAAVLEVCSEGTSPLAFELYRQSGAFGNAFAFLMGGVVTDYTEIGMLWKNIGPRTALWTVVLAIPQIILMALIFNSGWIPK